MPVQCPDVMPGPLLIVQGVQRISRQKFKNHGANPDADVLALQDRLERSLGRRSLYLPRPQMSRADLQSRRAKKDRVIPSLSE